MPFSAVGCMLARTLPLGALESGQCARYSDRTKTTVSATYPARRTQPQDINVSIRHKARDDPRHTLSHTRSMHNAMPIVARYKMYLVEIIDRVVPTDQRNVRLSFLQSSYHFASINFFSAAFNSLSFDICGM